MQPIALTRRRFGRHTLSTLGVYDTHVSFVAGQAGYVHQIKLAGRDLLWNYDDGEALDANDGYRALALLPFPNRLLEGRYTWDGRALELPVNMPDTRSAIHGIGSDARFRVDRLDLETDRAAARLTYLHTPDMHPRGYPFLVRFDLALGIDVRAAAASWDLRATNLGPGSAPVGLGWHPYFALPGGAEAWRVAMPPNRRVEMERAIPTGRLGPGLPAGHPLPVDDAWDDCFKLDDSSDRTVRLESESYSVVLSQSGDTSYTQLYVPPDSPAVAVEPMTCGVNAFAAEPDEVALPSGATVSTRVDISLGEPR